MRSRELTIAGGMRVGRSTDGIGREAQVDNGWEMTANSEVNGGF
jgi:hypothetical protein